MSNVTLSVAGRNYAIACADGEEDHVRSLGQLIEGKLADMGGVAGQTEARGLLFAALLLADEVHDLRGRIAQPEAPAPEPTPEPAPERPAIDPDVLETLARRLENCAAYLERRPPAS